MAGRWLILVALVSLVACSDYHPLKDGQGFADSPAGDDTYHVTYEAVSEMTVNEAWRFALVRAAELAALRDMQFFRIEEEHVDLTPALRYRPAINREIREPVQTANGAGGTAIVSRIEMPEYVQNYAMPRVSLVVRLATSPSDDAISAGAILRKALADDIPLSGGVEEHLAKLPPSTGPTTLPAPPIPMVRTIGK